MRRPVHKGLWFLTLFKGDLALWGTECSSVVIVKLLGGQVHLRVGLEHSELIPVAQDSVTFEENLKGTVQTGGVHRRLRALRCVSVEGAPSGGRAVRKSIKPLSR